MPILVTGASGFIGSELLRSDISGSIMRCTQHVNPIESFSGDIFLLSDLTEHTIWSGAFDGVSTVIHLAGIAHKPHTDKDEYIRINTNGTMKLALEAAKSGVKKFIYISSMKLSEGNPLDAQSESQKLAEKKVFEIGTKYSMNVIVIRSSLVYGVNPPAKMGQLFNIARNFPLLPFGLVDNKMNFISIYNLVDMIWFCAKNETIKNKIILCNDGCQVSIKSITNSISFGFGSKVYQVPIPSIFLSKLLLLIGKSNISDNLLISSKVKQDKINLVDGWSPPYTMLDSMFKINKMKRKNAKNY